MNPQTRHGHLVIKDLTLPIASIRQPEATLRREIDPIKLSALAQSMESIGQLQPIGVYPAAHGQYEWLFGQRRLSAATLLGWETIRASVFPISGQQQNLILSIQAAENLQNDHLKTIEVIEIIRRLKDSGLDNPAISQVLSQSPEWVSDHEFVLKNALARSIAEAATLIDAASLRAFMDFPPAIRNILMESA